MKSERAADQALAPKWRPGRRLWLFMRMSIPTTYPAYPTIPAPSLAPSLAPAPLTALTLARPTPPDQHPAAVYLVRLAPGSRRTMRQALDTIAGLLTGGRCDAVTCDWSALRYQHTAAVRAQLAEHYAPATANKMLAALRGVLQEAWRLGLMGVEEYRRAVDLKPVRGSTLPKGRALAVGELGALFAVCAADPSPAGRRDAALLAVLYGAGLRRSEAAALQLADFEAITGALRIRSGKGRKARLVYLPTESTGLLAAWLAMRGPEPGALFWPVDKTSRLLRRHLTGQAVLAIVARRAQAADVAAFSPHDLRRSFISDLLDAGADIATVQALAGHANVATTARYDRRGERAKQRAAGLLTIPTIPTDADEAS